MGGWSSNRVFRRAVLLTAYGVSAALVSAGLVPASQAWADTTPPPSPSPVEQAAPASGGVVDFPSAVIQARATGKRVEVTAERSESSSTWVNADGSLAPTSVPEGVVLAGEVKGIDAQPEGSLEGFPVSYE